MTILEKIGEEAFSKAEINAQRLIRIMESNYGDAQTEIIAKLEAIYGRYLATTDPQDYYNIMIQYDRLNKLLQEVQLTYMAYARKANKTQLRIASAAMQEVYYRQQYILQWISPVPLSFTMLDKNLVEFTVTGTLEAWNKIPKTKQMQLQAGHYVPQSGTVTKVMIQKDAESVAAIQRAITQGFIQGHGIPKLSENIQAAFETTEYKATRIARTEFTRCANAGSYAATQDAQGQGMNVRRKWLATLDGRTRDSHAALDGKYADKDGYFHIGDDKGRYPGNFSQAKNVIHCRCTVIDVVDGEEPQLRRARDSEDFSWRSYETWKQQNLKEE